MPSPALTAARAPANAETLASRVAREFADAHELHRRQVGGGGYPDSWVLKGGPWKVVERYSKVESTLVYADGMGWAVLGPKSVPVTLLCAYTLGHLADTLAEGARSEVPQIAAMMTLVSTFVWPVMFALLPRTPENQALEMLGALGELAVPPDAFNI